MDKVIPLRVALGIHGIDEPQYRAERQVRDALNVAVVRWPTLDKTYLRQWAVALA